MSDTQNPGKLDQVQKNIRRRSVAKKTQSSSVSGFLQQTATATQQNKLQQKLIHDLTNPTGRNSTQFEQTLEKIKK